MRRYCGRRPLRFAQASMRGVHNSLRSPRDCPIGYMPAPGAGHPAPPGAFRVEIEKVSENRGLSRLDSMRRMHGFPLPTSSGGQDAFPILWRAPSAVHGNGTGPGYTGSGILALNSWISIVCASSLWRIRRAQDMPVPRRAPLPEPLIRLRGNDERNLQ